MAQFPHSSETDSTPIPRTGSLPRRRVLAAFGAVTAGTLGVTGTATATAEYEVIEATGQTITVDSGETWEHKLIDMTTGEDIVIQASGSDWTIRNVGFHGENTSGTGTAMFGLADDGGSSTLECIYLGDGSDEHNASPTGHGQTAIWVNPQHSGHLDIEAVNVQAFADNAIYASAPGTGASGTVHVDRCYAANCYVSHYRLATEGSKVTNSAVLVDDDGYAGRGVWAWAPGTITVENCDLEMNGQNVAIDAGANGQATTVEVSDTEYDEAAGIQEHDGSRVDLDDDVGTDPEATIPDAVPESAEAAAAGE